MVLTNAIKNADSKDAAEATSAVSANRMIRSGVLKAPPLIPVMAATIPIPTEISTITMKSIMSCCTLINPDTVLFFYFKINCSVR